MGIEAGRNVLRERANVCEHAGLLLHRYLTEHDTEKLAQRKLYEQAAGTEVSRAYRLAFERRERLLTGIRFSGQLAAPLALGLGNESVLENGLTLLHTYGIPYCPGSALKGVARRAALSAGLSEAARITLFGVGGDSDEEAAGYITFHDAWYVPGSLPGDRPLSQDTITVHHPAYYQQEGESAPTDSDAPNPVPLLTVSVGARFAFCLSGPDPAWEQLAVKTLQWGLVNLGLGGKTSSGYGSFKADSFKEIP